MEVAAPKIKKGYKQTDVGVIPNEWDITSYDCFAFLGTATYSREMLSNDGDVGYIHYGDIHTLWNHRLDIKKSTLPKISSSAATKYPLICDGDVITVDASEDYSGVAKSVEVFNIQNNRVIAGLHTFLLRDKTKQFADGFRGYIHKIPVVKKQLETKATGMKVYGVSKNNLKKILIPLPPVTEQKDIATVLFNTDSLIQSLDALIEKKKNIKTATLQQLLTGKTRLPGFSGEWKTKKLSEFTEFGNGKPYEGFVVSKGKYKLITLDSISIEGNLKSEHRTVNFSDSSLRKDDLVMVLSDIAHARLLGLCDIIPEDNCYVLNQRMGRLRFTSEIDASFAKFQINKHQDFFRMRGQGSSQKHIYKKDVYELEIPLPPTKMEQTAIASILLDMGVELKELQKRRDKLIAIKQGMMHELLTGNTRLV